MNTRMDFRFICRSRFFLAIAVMFLAGALRANAQARCTGVSPDPQGAVTWNPAWCEEFNGAAGAPDPTVWTYDLGGGGFGNNELEIYCGPAGYAGNPSGCPGGAITSGTVYIDGSGHLVLQAVNPSGTWYSARLKTQGLQNFQYGRIEASIQLPDTSNQGLWPAFWSLGSDINTTPWPGCGEVDFMEVWSPLVPNIPGPGPAGDRTTLHTAITGGSGLQPNGVFTFTPPQANDTAFHTYGTIWSANMMQFYIDNPLQPYYIATTSNLPSGDTWAFNAQLFLLTNIAVGGTLGGTPSNLTPNPGIMMLDYVRQYQPTTPITAPTLGTSAITVRAGATSGNSSTLTPVLAANTGYVYFSCSTNAPKASCAISTNDPLNKFVVSSSATPAETVTVTVTTTANTSTAGTTAAQAIPPVFFHLPLSFFSPPLAFVILKTPVWLLIAFAGFLLAIVASAGRMRVRACLYGCTLAMGLILTGAASCGGGSRNTSGGTPPGSYTVTVYAFTESNVGTGANSTADASVAIPLTVN
jgi:beta-glucanase (GH16 family)